VKAGRLLRNRVGRSLLIAGTPPRIPNAFVSRRTALVAEAHREPKLCRGGLSFRVFHESHVAENDSAIKSSRLNLNDRGLSVRFLRSSRTRSCLYGGISESDAAKRGNSLVMVGYPVRERVPSRSTQAPLQTFFFFALPSAVRRYALSPESHQRVRDSPSRRWDHSRPVRQH